MTGEDLLTALTINSGLPQQLIKSELNEIILAAGGSPEQITLNEIREILASYMLDVLSDVLSDTSPVYE